MTRHLLTLKLTLLDHFTPRLTALPKSSKLIFVSIHLPLNKSHPPGTCRVIDSTADSFLLAFQRFVGQQGLPAVIWTDNAKIFTAAAKEIQAIVRSSEVTRYLQSNRVDWKFIVEQVPWWTGFWECMVRSVNVA